MNTYWPVFTFQPVFTMWTLFKNFTLEISGNRELKEKEMKTFKIFYM